MDGPFLSDVWIKDFLSNYSIICGLASAVAVGLLKILAIRHPNVPTNKIIEYLTSLKIRR